MLDQDVRRDLRSLAKDTAELVARHLVRTGQLLDNDPQTALVHARAAVALAGRVAAVREAAGLAAYAAGEWREAMAELRAARRLSGSPEHLAVLADCERGLGRPERALAVLDDPDVARLDPSARAELMIVVSGARRDLGQPAAAVLVLQDAARAARTEAPWAARVFYAYADALVADGRNDEAAEWFARCAGADLAGETDADDRLLELEGVHFLADGAPEEGPADGAGEDGSDEDRSDVASDEADVAALLVQVTERSRQARSEGVRDTPASKGAQIGREIPAVSPETSTVSVERPSAPAVSFLAPGPEALSDAPGDATESPADPVAAGDGARPGVGESPSEGREQDRLF